MSKYTKSKRKWVDKNVYSFSISNRYDCLSIFHEKITFTRNMTKSEYSGTLSSDFQQIKDRFSSGFFNSQFWKTRSYAIKMDYIFKFERKIS